MSLRRFFCLERTFLRNGFSFLAAVLASGGVPLPAASVDVGQAAMLVPEYGRSVASTQQEMIIKMAQQIVGLMEEPW